MSWEDDLDAEAREQWDRFVAHQREEVLAAMVDSACVISLVPDHPEKFDIKFAVETGMAVMLGKPIVLIIQPGAKVPGKLGLVADKVVDVDIDTEDGQSKLMEALRELGLAR